jgi:hypothetical protein
MKLVIQIVFLLLPAMTFCQPLRVLGKITYGNFPGDYRGVSLLLNHADSTLQTTTADSKGEFVFNHVKRGFYNIVIRIAGHTAYLADGLFIVADKSVDRVIIYPPCGLSYLKDERPFCPKDPNDNVIPISYGKPTSGTVDKANKGLVRLGGCKVAECSPRFYCTIHDLEF